MADPSPADTDDGAKTATAGEGQEPAGDEKPAAEERRGKTYSESYVQQLRREAAETRNKLAEAEEKLQERDDADKTELQKALDRAAKAESERAALETFRDRVEVGAEHGLDAEVSAKFLTGATREEIELRAEELGKLLAERNAKPTAGFDGGARPRAPDPTTPEEAHNEFLLRAMGKTPGGRASR